MTKKFWWRYLLLHDVVSPARRLFLRLDEQRHCVPAVIALTPAMCWLVMLAFPP